MFIISRTDLHTYLADTRADIAERYIDAVLDQIQHSDHPAWGSDWSEWLEEEIPRLVIAVVDGLDALPTEESDDQAAARILGGDDVQEAEAAPHGLTFAAWLTAAGRSDSASEYDLRAAWRAGESPEEYR